MYMKKLYSPLFLMLPLVFALEKADGQTWCVPTTAMPYTVEMPGITNFTLNTINRTSADCENYPNNNYVMTGLSTTLMRGNSYTVSITHTIDAVYFPGSTMYLRLWIDYNQDGQLDDVGETVYSFNLSQPGTHTGTFTVPMTATLGNTRMRATAKMDQSAGHTLPTPCDMPADPGGYHGELEDYTANITTSSAVENISNIFNEVSVSPNPATDKTAINFSLKQSSNVSVEIYNIAGEKIATVSEGQQGIGEHIIFFNPAELNLESGIYFVKLTADNAVVTKRLAVLK